MQVVAGKSHESFGLHYISIEAAPSIFTEWNTALAFCRLIVSVKVVLNESITVLYRYSSAFLAPWQSHFPNILLAGLPILEHWGLL